MPRVRPARGSRSNGSHFPSAWLRSMRRTPLAKKRRAAIANSARAGLYTPRAFVSTAGLATRAGNSTSSTPAEREWTQLAPAARSHTDSRAERRIEQTKTASGAWAPAKSSRAAPRMKVTPAGAGSSTCRPGSRCEASTQTVTGRMAPDGTTELGSKAHRRGCDDDHRPREPDPPPARARRDADDLGGPRVPPLGGGGGGAPAAGPGRARDRHLRRPGLRRPRPVHDAGRAAGRLLVALRAGRAGLPGAGRHPRAFPGRALPPLCLRGRDPFRRPRASRPLPAAGRKCRRPRRVALRSLRGRPARVRATGALRAGGRGRCLSPATSDLSPRLTARKPGHSLGPCGRRLPSPGWHDPNPGNAVALNSFDSYAYELERFGTRRRRPGRGGSPAPGGAEGPQGRRDPRRASGRRLLLAARQEGPRGGRLPRGRERLRGRAAQAHPGPPGGALQGDAGPHQGDRHEGPLPEERLLLLLAHGAGQAVPDLLPEEGQPGRE